MIASWTPWIVVSRSATICEIDTFMTLLSSTITNCADAKIAIGSPRPVLLSSELADGHVVTVSARSRARSAAMRVTAEVSGAARIRPTAPNRAPPAIVTINTASG